MKLAPESVRLRRMARAYAAGEVSENDYRAARRDIIDNFSSRGFSGSAPADDETRPRWSDEPTLRSSGRMDAPEGSILDKPRPAFHVPRAWLWVTLLACLLTAVLLTLPQARAAVAEPRIWIPPLAQRDPDPATSPRLTVRQVQVVWAGATDELSGTTLAALQQRADTALERVRARSLPEPHGFTTDELQQVARFLNVLGVHEPNAALDAADARDLNALIREQKRRRGISVAQLEEVAGEVQASLREQGYFLGAAYLPAQNPSDGVVRLAALPGRLGEVVVQGGNPDRIVNLFAGMLGGPVTMTDVAARLQTLNALPGFTAQASFGPGSGIGESRLRLDVREQREWVASASLDNHGDDATGDQRLGATVTWLNPRGVGDHISAGGLVTVNPANQRFGYLEYATPAADDYLLTARIGNNDFSLDGPIDLDGGGLFLDVSARRSLWDERSSSLAVVLAGTRQRLDWDDGTEQTVSLGEFGLAGHRVWDRARVAADFALAVSFGRVGGDRILGQRSDFRTLEFDTQAWMPVSLPWLDGEQKLVLRLAGQWSDSLLPATRRFALGGAHRARGFDRAAFLADRGALLGLEARQPLRLGELVLFVESGYGDALAEGAETWGRLSDLGLGWEAELMPSLFSQLSLARRLAIDGTGDPDADGYRVYWSLRYDY